MIVQSGNDATIALAERIAGTEEHVCADDERQCQAPGHGRHAFRKQLGLPSPQHYTTARDMSLLANAMIRDYPQYYKWLLGARVRAQRHQAAKSQRPAREGSHASTA